MALLFLQIHVKIEKEGFGRKTKSISAGSFHVNFPTSLSPNFGRKDGNYRDLDIDDSFVYPHL